MSEELRIPAERDLPRGRLEMRKEQLVRELEVMEGERRRRTRRAVLVLVPAVVLLVAATGFTTYFLTREPTHFDSIGCFDARDTNANVAVVDADGRDPREICAEVWREGAMRPGTRTAPPLVACVLATGAVGVFPASGAGACERIGLADLPAAYAGQARRFAAVRAALADTLGVPGSGRSVGRAGTCLGRERTVLLVRRELDAHGLVDWAIEVARDGFGDGRCVVQLSFDGKRKVAVLIPVPE